MAVGVQIFVRRGTRAELSGITINNGELYFCTDTHQVFIGDSGGLLPFGNMISGVIASRPTAGQYGRFYRATDESNKMYFDNGSTWILVGGVESLDAVADGTTYGKVLLTELSSGQVARIRAVTAAANITGDQIKTHMDDSTIHRSINDSGSSNTDLWSAQKIASEIAAVSEGLDFKQSCRAATAGANITLSGIQTIDGVSLVAGNRVLVKDQTNAAQNGIYVVASGSWTRSSDADNTPNTGEVTSGMYTFIEEGSENANCSFVLTTNDPIVLDTTPLVFSLFDKAGDFTAGDGLDLTGNTFSVDVTDIIGTGLSEDSSNNLRIAAQGNGIAGGDGSLLSVKPYDGSAEALAAVDVSANGVAIKIDNSSIKKDGSNNLYVYQVDGGSFV